MTDLGIRLCCKRKMEADGKIREEEFIQARCSREETELSSSEQTAGECVRPGLSWGKSTGGHDGSG